MSNIKITATNIEFTATNKPWILLIEPRWEIVDDYSLHVLTEQGIYLISIKEHKINDQIFNTSAEAITYLNNL